MLINKFLPAIFGLFGTILGVSVTIFYNIKKSKNKDTFDLFKEFNSDKIKDSRNLAYKLLKNYPNKNYDLISESLSAKETNPLWHITGFYQRLWILIEYNQISTKLVPKLFGELFVWWYYFSFKENLVPVNWEVSKDIEKLFNWMKQKSNKNDFEVWEQRIKSKLKVLSNEKVAVNQNPQIE